jgi:hypothetical protein
VPLSKQYPICRGTKQSKKTVLGPLVPEDKGNTIFRNFDPFLLVFFFVGFPPPPPGLLARSQYSEGPASDHLDIGFFLVSLCL